MRNTRRCQLSRKRVLWGVLIVTFLLPGCMAQTTPLATLPLEHPQAAQINLAGIDRYQQGEWAEALLKFQEALQQDANFPEAHFNAALALHQLGRHEEATQHFRRAGELAPEHQAIVTSVLYRNHLGLSSTLERHLSGGYRYHASPDGSIDSPLTE